MAQDYEIRTVRPEQRGSGVAERLLRAAIDWSWQRPEIARVRLWATAENERAYAFYSRLGFTPTGVTMPHPPDPTLTGCELELPRKAA